MAPLTEAWLSSKIETDQFWRTRNAWGSFWKYLDKVLHGEAMLCSALESQGSFLQSFLGSSAQLQEKRQAQEIPGVPDVLLALRSEIL